MSSNPHNGVIRVAPAIDKRWSGIFQLRAEGGFLVAPDIYTAAGLKCPLTSFNGKPKASVNPHAVASGLPLNEDT